MAKLHIDIQWSAGLRPRRAHGVARTLGPLHDTAIEPIRTEIQGNLAYVQVRARYAAGKDQPTWYRGVMIWRKEADGQWRMLHEMLVRERPSRE